MGRTSYTKDKSCNGGNSDRGSVTVEANQVGFLCDNQKDVAVEDFVATKCTDTGCFSEKQCQKKFNKWFGPLANGGQAGINPAHRLIKTRYLGKSSFRISLGIECDKPAGQTCTRNFIIRTTYQNIKKRCPVCKEREKKNFLIDKTTVSVNNLGGLGPSLNAPQELRFKTAGQRYDGRYFDLVVRVAEGYTYKSRQAAERNGAQEGSRAIGNINIDVPASTANKGIEMTKFIFTIQDSLTGDELVLDNFDLYLYDLDVNKQLDLHERACINLDQIDSKASVLPAQDGDVTVVQLDDLDCQNQPSATGSVRLESQGVGFLCDNPKKSRRSG